MSRLARTFIAGLLVILPIVLTIVLVVWVANIVITFVGPNSVVGQHADHARVRVLRLDLGRLSGRRC